MNLKEIKDLINLMNEHGLVELEIEREGLRIRIAKGKAVGIGQTAEAPALVTVETRVPASEKPPATVLPANTIQIKAPMVGTFYRTPSPDAEAFVQEGDMIEEGQVICIIEAMKLMNEIKAEVKGKILKVLVENGQAVEFGQPLFLVEKEN